MTDRMVGNRLDGDDTVILDAQAHAAADAAKWANG